MKHPKFLNTLSIMNYNIIQSLLLIVSLSFGFNAYCQGKITRPTQQQSQTITPQKSVPEVTVSEPDGYINGHGYVDLGLPSGTKWATCNVGASKPSDYGNYYAWGEIKPKPSYNWRNCFDCLHPSGYTFREYKQNGKTEITPPSGHDTARENWGGTWRMPTASELNELRTKCTMEWTQKDGHKGYLVTGINGKNIFIPAAGYRDGETLYDEGKGCNYWSSSLSKDLYKRDSYASYLILGDLRIIDVGLRCNGLSVRPITE